MESVNFSNALNWVRLSWNSSSIGLGKTNVPSMLQPLSSTIFWIFCGSQPRYLHNFSVSNEEYDLPINFKILRRISSATVQKWNYQLQENKKSEFHLHKNSKLNICGKIKCKLWNLKWSNSNRDNMVTIVLHFRSKVIRILGTEQIIFKFPK